MSSTTISTSCRACLNETLESYFEMDNQCHFSQDNNSLLDIFNLCTHLKVQLNDGFPRRICALCSQDLQQSYRFLQKVMASETKLNELNKKQNNDQTTDMENINDTNDMIKDPLENLTDSEENFVKEQALENMENNYESSSVSSSFDNTDNTTKDCLDVSKPLPSPTALFTAHRSDDSDDTNDGDGDFFKSVESQIFPQGRLKCKICYKSYFTSAGLQAHMDIHLPKAKTLSKETSKHNFSDDRCLKTNKKIIKSGNVSDRGGENDSDNKITKIFKNENKSKKTRPKKLFPCHVCGKQMISASKLRYHMVMHTGEKDYLCTMCPKAYSTIYALKHHMRAHTGERPYECKFCGDRFLRPTTLKSHMRRHTGERPYGCDICGKRFIQHSSMATHMKLNHMDKTIPCPYCDKKYARQTDLNTHLLSHSGDKPFACRLCPSRFTRQSNLNKHMNQHHGGASMGGDKKMKYRSVKDTMIENAKNEIPPQETANDDEALYMFEKPSSSSNLKTDEMNSSSLTSYRSGSSHKTNFQQPATANVIELTTNEFNRWSWSNQT